tara:strand:- start:523 stop:735 length:213 start_codon:yes stop_codon:yes gene_type:complete
MKKENKKVEYWLPKINPEFYQTKEYKRFVKLCEEGRAIKDIVSQLEEARKIKAFWAEIEADLLNEYKKLL